MEKLLSIKEKLKNINISISKIEEASISMIEKDILLFEIREVYVLINSLDIDVDSKPVIDKEPQIEKNVEVLVKNEIVKEEKIDIIDFVEETIVEEKVELVTVTKEEIKSEPVVQSKPVVEAPKQQNLFGNNAINGNGNVKTVGESLGQNKTSLNERLAGHSNPNDISSQIRQKPVSDIKAAIGIGDRFLYIRELFNGNIDVFESTISYLNSLNSFDAANSYLADNFDWDLSQESVVNFVNVVKRKYL